MPTLTVRNLSNDELAAFRMRAAVHGRSMEAEARELIRSSLPRAPLVIEPKEQGCLVVDPEIEARVQRAQAIVREMFGGELPKGRVDAFLAERRAEAARGE